MVIVIVIIPPEDYQYPHQPGAQRRSDKVRLRVCKPLVNGGIMMNSRIGRQEW